ncbi:MAG: hypothetical protein JHC28_05380 [Thermoprotei archaeon]|jgi:predicted transcriptional regulator|uniref:ArnR1-like winged helix-turn-helix domain-containing protein n=1 Tax=Fervidicoccus fontis TaxID=683846 RepID=A0A7J3SKX8_9CREN|nr:hypothetical protein [Thermoprotei archaeon]
MMSVIVSGGEQGIKKTHLMYKTNLNSKMLQKYLNILERGGLITEISLGKQKLVKLTPLGIFAYSSLKALSNILSLTGGVISSSEQTSKYLDELAKTNLPISSGKSVLGKSGIMYYPDAIVDVKGESYLVKFIMGKKGFESSIEFLNFVLMVVDSEKKGLVITDNPDIEKIVPKKLAEDLKVVSVISPEKIAEKVKAILQL